MGVCYHSRVKSYCGATNGNMEIMEFILGAELGIVAGWLLRGAVHRLDFRLKDFTYGSKKKNTH